MVDNLKIFPFLKSRIINNLKSEMPKYLALAEDVSPRIDKNDWWRKHETELPHWSKACKSVEPSSAAAERVFLFFQTVLRSSKCRHWRTSIMLQYNKQN